MALKDYLIKSDRLKSSKSISLVDPARFDEFFAALKANEESVPLWFRVYLAVSMSGGLRVTEALNLQLKNIDWDQEKITEIKVLKKRPREKIVWEDDQRKFKKDKPITRDIFLHPVALELLKEYVASFKDKKIYNNLFNISLATIHNYCKKYLDKEFCSHSSRHAHISFWLHEVKKPTQWIAKFMKIDQEVVVVYSHINTKGNAANPFRKRISHGKTQSA